MKEKSLEETRKKIDRLNKLILAKVEFDNKMAIEIWEEHFAGTKLSHQKKKMFPMWTVVY